MYKFASFLICFVSYYRPIFCVLGQTGSVAVVPTSSPAASQKI